MGIAFTRFDRLAAAMGERQRWMRLSESALRAMLTPLGIGRIQLDPILVGPEITPPPLKATTRRQPTKGRPAKDKSAKDKPAKSKPASRAAASDDIKAKERVPVTAGVHRG
ncbi:SAV_915 family protein [Micromonospora sp. IBHARD004]|uniref:SAV_915 family protein n=1 Tax=Micromonospora sp. IBHARD004 TaxID=3457764 RepID=UPI004058B7BF